MNTIAKRHWPAMQFSLRELLFSIAIVVMGIGGIAGIVGHAAKYRDIPLSILYGIVYGFGSLIGVGLFRLLKRPILGAIIGFVTAVVIVAYFEVRASQLMSGS